MLWYFIDSKTCLKRPLKKKTKIVFQDRLSLNAGQRIAECSLLQYFRPSFSYHLPFKTFIIPRRSRRDIVLASSVRPSVHSVRPSGFISQYLLVRFDSFLVQMISTMDSRYLISLVKIDPLTLELLPLF